MRAAETAERTARWRNLDVCFLCLPLYWNVEALSDIMAAADTIRILVATDSHVGYEERDPIRKDDSWKSFHEVMCLAKTQDVRSHTPENGKS